MLFGTVEKGRDGYKIRLHDGQTIVVSSDAIPESCRSENMPVQLRITHSGDPEGDEDARSLLNYLLHIER